MPLFNQPFWLPSSAIHHHLLFKVQRSAHFTAAVHTHCFNDSIQNVSHLPCATRLLIHFFLLLSTESTTQLALKHLCCPWQLIDVIELFLVTCDCSIDWLSDYDWQVLLSYHWKCLGNEKNQYLESTIGVHRNWVIFRFESLFIT